MIDNVRSAHNVGSLFRTSDAAGVSHIYCVGYTPTPFDKFARPQKDIAKTALGAETSLPWTHKDDMQTLVTQLTAEGFSVVALEQSPHALDYRSLPRQIKKIALVVGNEVGGITSETLSLCDYCIEIPMRGQKESLNVSVAAGIALYALIH